MINYIFPAKDLKQSFKDISTVVLPTFLKTVDPRFPENRKRLSLFILVLILEVAKSFFISYLSQFRTGVDNAVTKKTTIDAIFDSSIQFFLASSLNFFLNFAQRYVFNKVIIENKINALLKLLDYNQEILHNDKSPQDVKKDYEKSNNVQYYAADISFKLFTHSIRFLTSSYYLYNLMTLNSHQNPYKSTFAKIYERSGFALIFAFTYAIITNIIPNLITKHLTKLDTEKRALQKTYDNSVIELEQSTERQRIHGMSKQEAEATKKIIKDHLYKELQYENSKTVLHSVNHVVDITGHILSLIIAIPFFEARIIPANLALPREISAYLKNISNALKLFAGDEVKHIERLKRDSQSIEEIFETAQKQRAQFEKFDRKVSYETKTYKFDQIEMELGDTDLKQKKQIKIEPGEIIQLIGQSGFGKTSILNSIANRRLIPSGGKIEYACKNNEILLIPQKNSFDKREEFSTIGHFMLYGIKDAIVSHNNKLYVESDLSSKAINLLEKLKFTPEKLALIKENLFDKNCVEHLSGGEIKKLAIANALLKEPKFLLMDETLSGIDIEARNAIVSFLKNHVKYNKVTIIFVEHTSEKNHLANEEIFADRTIKAKEYFDKITKTPHVYRAQQPQNQQSTSLAM